MKTVALIVVSVLMLTVVFLLNFRSFLLFLVGAGFFAMIWFLKSSTKSKSSTILIVVGITVLAIWLTNKIKSNQTKYIAAPLSKKMVSSLINEEWDIDIHNHILRVVRRGVDDISREGLLGAIQLKNKFSWTIESEESEIKRNFVVDIFEYDKEQAKLGELVCSYNQPKRVILSTNMVGNLLKPNQWYLPLIRVGGELNKTWLESIKIYKNKSSLSWKWSWIKRLSSVWSKSELKPIEENILSVPNHPGTQIKFNPIQVYPPSSYVHKRVAAFPVLPQTQVTLYYLARKNGSIISAQVTGNRVEELDQTPGIQRRDWTIFREGQALIAETLYGEYRDFTVEPTLAISE